MRAYCPDYSFTRLWHLIGDVDLNRLRMLDAFDLVLRQCRIQTLFAFGPLLCCLLGLLLLPLPFRKRVLRLSRHGGLPVASTAATTTTTTTTTTVSLGAGLVHVECTSVKI